MPIRAEPVSNVELQLRIAALREAIEARALRGLSEGSEYVTQRGEEVSKMQSTLPADPCLEGLSQHSAVRKAHPNLDPVTGHCADCGSTREEIDDNLVPVCYPATGPNREAIIALRGLLRHRRHEVEHRRNDLQRAEHSCVALSRAIRDGEARAREIVESLRALGDTSPLAVD